jgi:hypothetical protein
LLNQREDYRIGGGLMSAGGPGDGTWNCVTGPWYTCANFIKREDISVEVDGTLHPLRCDMFRGRLTGVYLGVATIGEVEISLVDSAPFDQPWVTRLVAVNNLSRTVSHSVRIVANIHIAPDSNVHATVAGEADGTPQCLCLRMGLGVSCMSGPKSGWVPNRIERTLLIGFARTAEVAVGREESAHTITSAAVVIPAGGWHDFGLIHLGHTGQRPAQVYLDQLRAIAPAADTDATIQSWRAWFASVKPAFSLDRIPAGRARDIVEGSLCYLKTNQSSDGGIVANLPKYTMAWTRDAYCGLRGLLATGHHDESRRFILFMHRKFLAHGFIPNAMSCGSDTFALYNGNGENNPGRQAGAASPCPEANTAPETPALLVLAARDYHRSTGDDATLLEINVTLRHCLDIQLMHATANGYRLESSGDETELCGAVATKAAGYDRRLERHWSMASMALAIASMDFLIAWFKRLGEDPTAYRSAMDGRTYDLHTELVRFQEALERDFWRTDDPHAPGGVHVWCRIKDGHRFPPGHIANLTLFPLYHGTALLHPERAANDAAAVRSWFDPVRRSLPLVPVVGDGRYLGHDLGYLLWCLVKTGDQSRHTIHDALVNGPSASCWGTFAEAYDADGKPNYCRLRTFESGVNVDAIAFHHGLGAG